MDNQVVKTNQMSMNDVINISKMFYESGMFSDSKSIAQIVVKVQAGQEIGVAPFASITGIHIIKGKPVLGAGLIASRVKASGKYDYIVVELDNEKCILEFYQGSKSLGLSVFTIHDAKKAGTGASDAGSGKNIDKFTRNMLFARAISNGVKWYCPDVFSGPVYSEGEIEADPIPDKKTYQEKIISSFEKITTFDEWDKLVLKCLGLKPELEGDKWFDETIHKYRPKELTIDDIVREALEESSAVNI